MHTIAFFQFGIFPRYLLTILGIRGSASQTRHDSFPQLPTIRRGVCRLRIHLIVVISEVLRTALRMN